jgi:hypothetical protein
MIDDMKEYTDKFLLSGLRKQAKGYIRLGHDVLMFNYGGAFRQLAPIKSSVFSRRRSKGKVDEALVRQIKGYYPDIVYVSFANFLDVDTVALIRQAAPSAFLLSVDGDPWPQYQKDRVVIGSKVDLVLATNNGEWLDEYRKTGVGCAFMPNPCDPDIDHRYEVDDKWKTNLLFTGKTRESNKRYPTDPMRAELVKRLAKRKDCAIYGCLDRPRIGGMDYLYAISGARIALGVNIAHDVSMYHSDRLIHYLAGGAFVLAKRVPDSDRLFKDGEHLRYFDSIDEFFELADWYLEHEDERRRIADRGMERTHAEFNGTKIAQYTLEVIEKGGYDAPWQSG